MVCYNFIDEQFQHISQLQELLDSRVKSNFLGKISVQNVRPTFHVAYETPHTLRLSSKFSKNAKSTFAQRQAHELHALQRIARISERSVSSMRPSIIHVPVEKKHQL